MKILVTGGAGFIGHHLVKMLVDRGDDVIVLDNLSSGKKERLPQSVTFIESDVLTLSEQALPSGIEAIIHLAAQIDVRLSEDDPLYDATQNVLGTIAVLEYAKQQSIPKVIFASSAAVYGDVKQLPVEESYLGSPKVPYGVSKRCSELYMQLYADSYGIETVCLRYANVYGPGQEASKESGVITVFCEKARLNEPLTINGDGSITRDFIHVKDIARANIAALKPGIVGVFNISTETQTSLLELAQLLQVGSKKQLEIFHADEKKGDIKHSCLANREAQERLRWKPEIDLESGIQMTMDSFI